MKTQNSQPLITIYLENNMSSYFPLLPSVSLKSSSISIKSSTTLLNNANNLKESNQSKKHIKSIFVGTYKLSGFIWELISSKECKYGEFHDITRNSINVSTDQMVVSLLRKKNSFPKYTRILPKPDSLKVDSSPVAERASLNYHFKGTTTTFQGEYPYEMANLDKGSFWSLDALKEDLNTNKSLESFLILMNINRDAEKQFEVNLDIYNPDQKDKCLNWKALHNSFTVIDLREINKLLNSKQNQKTLFIQCKNCTFIPIFLNIDSKSNQLSMEHMHPPHELLWGRDKFTPIKLLKDKWILK